MFKLFIATALLVVSTPAWVNADNITQAVGEFSTGSLYGWEEKEFDGDTQYEMVFDKEKQQKVLRAISQNGASGLFREQRIDLTTTPWLNWSWKTNSLLKGVDESEKSGDDFTARIYIVVDGGYFFWKTIALNYVWSSSHQKNEKWASPYTSNSTMFAIEAGQKNLGVWQTYKRNIREDLAKLVGKDMLHIDAIAIMTDTDNSGLQATTYFGDIFFTSQ